MGYGNKLATVFFPSPWIIPQKVKTAYMGGPTNVSNMNPLVDSDPHGAITYCKDDGIKPIMSAVSIDIC